MTAKPRIRIDLIDEVQGVLEALPQHQPDEVTKSQAIQRLVPQIRASRSKGYSLSAIGKVLTERGIPVTTGALRAYLSGASARPGGKRKPRQPKRTAEGAPSMQPAGPKADAAIARARQPQAPEPPPRKTPAGSGTDLDWELAGRSEKVAPAPGHRAPTPRTDTDPRDI
jgi:hypothetical protein